MGGNLKFGIKPLYPDWNTADEHFNERIGFRQEYQMTHYFPLGSKFFLYLNGTKTEKLKRNGYGEKGMTRIVGVAECNGTWEDGWRFEQRSEQHSASLPIKITLLLKNSRDGVLLKDINKECQFDPWNKHNHYCDISESTFGNLYDQLYKKTNWGYGEIPTDFKHW